MVALDAVLVFGQASSGSNGSRINHRGQISNQISMMISKQHFDFHKMDIMTPFNQTEKKAEFSPIENSVSARKKRSISKGLYETHPDVQQTYIFKGYEEGAGKRRRAR
jgi:hypothetical protein